MAKTTIDDPKVPFNMRGPDAVLVLKVRDALETRLGTRLSAVQVARIAFQTLAKREKVA